VDANFTNLLVALGGTNATPYTLPTPTGTGSPVLNNNPTFSGNVLIGSGATTTRFPNTISIVSNITTNQHNEPHRIGLLAEGVGSTTTSTATGSNGANTISLSAVNAGVIAGQGVSGTGIATNATVTGISGTTITLSANNTGAVSGTVTFANYGIGLYGSGYTNGGARSGGVVGEGHVSASLDAGAAIGVRGYANDAHSGGMNIGLYGDATGGASNYSLYLNRGDIYSAGVQNWTLNGNLTLTGAYTVTIPTLSLGNALPIASGGTGSTSASAALTALGAYAATNPSGYTTNVGTVTSVAISVPSFLSAGSAITTSGTIAISLSGTALPVANGGTGSTSASAALTALGAYASTNPSGYTSNTGTVTSVGGTSPISSSGGTAPTISISQSSSSANGYLSSTDWNAFSGKQAPIGTISGLAKGNGANALTAATAGTDYVAPGTATTFTKPQTPSTSAETAPSTNAITWDLTTNQIFRINLNANITTFNLTGTLSSLVGNQYEAIVRYNGGSTISWNANMKWTAATAPTLTGTSGKIDVFTFVVASTDGTNYYLVNTGIKLNVG
jgi:hypothetical protein